MLNTMLQTSGILPAILIGILCVFVYKCVKFVMYYWDLRRKLRKLPGIQPHWLLGNIRKGQVTNSLSLVEIVRKLTDDGHKTLCLWVGLIPVVSVTHPETFKELTKNCSLKARSNIDAYRLIEPWIGVGLLVGGGKKWERNRKLLTPAFHFDILNGYVQVMNEGVDVFLNKLAEATSCGKYVDVFPFVCCTTLDAMLKCSLSYEGNIQKETSTTETAYIEAVRRVSEIILKRSMYLPFLIDSIFHLSSTGREFSRLVDLTHKFTGQIIQSRIKELERNQTDTKPKSRKLDFLDILLTATDDEGRGLSAQEIQDEVDTFTFEGHDTTASAISWAIYALGKYPDLQQKVYEDVQNVLDGDTNVTSCHLGQFKYLPLFIKETLRYYSPVPIIGRRHTKPIVLDGYEIPVGASVYIQIYAIHHNEEIWPNNMVFNPDRFNVTNRDGTELYGFIPFSAGSRNCIGQVFAMNEIKICLAKLVNRYDVKLDPEHEPLLLPDIVMRAENGIRVRLEYRN